MRQPKAKPAQVRYYKALVPCVRLGVLAGDIIRVNGNDVKVVHSLLANADDIEAALDAGVFREIPGPGASAPAASPKKVQTRTFSQRRTPAVRRTASGRMLSVVAGGAS